MVVDSHWIPYYLALLYRYTHCMIGCNTLSSVECDLCEDQVEYDHDEHVLNQSVTENRNHKSLSLICTKLTVHKQ